jgi:protein-tyrosine phosphatase
MHVVFVCTGNICRSPMAAAVFTGHLQRAGLAEKVRVSSAGIGTWHIGEAADPRAMAVLDQHGYPLEHAAAQVGPEHLDADLVLALDNGHLRSLQRLVGDRERVRLLRSFDPTSDAGAEVPDPYFGADDGFTDVLTMLEASMPELLDWVRSRL